jgi:hypothetical protein
MASAQKYRSSFSLAGPEEQINFEICRKVNSGFSAEAVSSNLN